MGSRRLLWWPSAYSFLLKIACENKWDEGESCGDKKNSSNKGLGMCYPVVAVKGGVVAVWWQQGGCHLFLPFSGQKQMRGRCEVVFGVTFFISRE